MRAAIVGLFLTSIAMAYGQSPTGHHCPMMRQDESKMKHDEMMKQGELAMGFSQAKTTHHFHLSASGGYIEVQTNDSTDAASRDHVRHHLREIAKSFGEGDFSSPMLTHGTVPPGVVDLQRLRSSLTYAYVETDHGAKVLISTTNAEALRAVHDFLRFQIQEHKTGDSEMVEK